MVDRDKVLEGLRSLDGARERFAEQARILS